MSCARGYPADIRTKCITVPSSRPLVKKSGKGADKIKEIACEMMTMDDLKRLRGEL
jgi:hypothetical protein